MDCVVHKFDYQVPYKQKKDISMKLQYLNGIGDDEDEDSSFDAGFDLGEIEVPEDAEALLLHGEDLEGLAGKAKRQEKKAARKEKKAEKKEERKEHRAEKKANKPPLKERVGKALHVINRLNPATALLRAGILASMKLNIGNVAGKLRYSYWSDAQAQANNVDMEKFVHLKAIRQKMEKIFHGAGGKPENLKKSILTGHGNKDKRVSLNGLGAITSPVNDYQPLHTVVGRDIYADEFSDVQTVNGLGEPISLAAAVAAASAVVGSIAGLIKKLGSMFKKGSPEAEKEAIADNTANEEEKTRKFSVKNIVTKIAPLAEKLRNAAPADSAPAPDAASDDAADDDDAAPDPVVDAAGQPPVMSDHAPDLDDYAPVDPPSSTAPSASDQLPAPITAPQSVPPTTTSADEVDLTKDLDTYDPPSSSIIKSAASGDKSSGDTSSNKFWQWVKDHTLLAAVGAVTVVAGGFAIAHAVKANKSKGSRKPALNGVDGLEGVDGAPKRRRKSKTTSKRRRSKTPARRRKPAAHRRGGFRRVELK